MTTRPRRIAYDWEFIESPHHPLELVSVGLVDVDSPALTYYAVVAELDLTRLMARPWLAENVAPHLPILHTPLGARRYLSDDSYRLDTSNVTVRPRAQIADEVLKFITGSLTPGQPIELWTDYGAYDHVALGQLYGGMAGYPPALPMFSHDLRQLLRDRYGDEPPLLPAQDRATLHHAGHDAAWLAMALGYITDRDQDIPRARPLPASRKRVHA